MTPDDRAPDLKPSEPDPFAGRPLPPSSANVEVRAREFRDRVMELITLHDVSADRAVLRTYRDFDRVHHADQHAPGWNDLGAVSKVIAFIIVLTVLAVLIPLLGWVIGAGLIPLWHWAFSWL